MTTTIPTLAGLMADWQQETREHAVKLQDATNAALRAGTSDTPMVASSLVLTTPDVESEGDGVLYTRVNRLLGPWVRVYDTTGNPYGNGAFVWANGRRIVHDHAVSEVVYDGDDWDAVAALAARWPVRPCSSSLDRYPSSDADDAETDDDRAEADYCDGCEKNAPVVRDPAGGWVRVAHRTNGELIPTD